MYHHFFVQISERQLHLEYRCLALQPLVIRNRWLSCHNQHIRAAHYGQIHGKILTHEWFTQSADTGPFISLQHAIIARNVQHHHITYSSNIPNTVTSIPNGKTVTTLSSHTLFEHQPTLHRIYNRTINGQAGPRPDIEQAQAHPREARERYLRPGVSRRARKQSGCEIERQAIAN